MAARSVLSRHWFELLYGKGPVLYMDNYFTSPILFQQLTEHQMEACDTVRVNRLGVPDHIWAAIPCRRDPAVSKRETNILCISWQDE